ncbi:hypothetical protein ACFLTE_02320 [Bacteroidota bacterium]
MKKSILLFVAILIGFIVTAQDDYRTIFGDGNIKKIRGFGGPLMTFTTIDGEFAHMMGGGGGIILNDQLIFGGFGSGVTNRINAERTVNGSTLYEDQEVDFGYGGLWFGYIINGNAPIHPVIHTQLGWGSLEIMDKNDFIAHSTDPVFILNPIVEIEMNITRFFRLSVGGNYRFGFGVGTQGFSDGDISGPGGFLAFKFGWF